MMWPLLAASIVTIAIAVERSVFYRRSASDPASRQKITQSPETK